MGGAEGTKQAASCLIYFFFCGGGWGVNIFAKSNPSQVFSLRWLQVEGSVLADLQGCSTISHPADWFALVCSGLAGGLVCMHRPGPA